MNPDISPEEQATALRYCSENLNGIWKRVTLKDVEICRVSGGMSNLLYYCALSNKIETLHNEPSKVLLRIYGPTHGDTDLQLEVFNQLAAEKLGPSLYGTFEGGRLEEYLPSRPLKSFEISSYEVSAVVGRKIAAIHKLNVKSLPRESKSWLLDNLKNFNNFIATSSKLPLPFKEDTLESTKRIAHDLMKIDFEAEIEYLGGLIQESEAPLVFSHNDLHQNNIIMMHGSEDSSLDTDRLDDRIVLIDFEYCSYNYRAFDLANYLSEWCFDYTGEDYPYFSASLTRFPTKEKQIHVLRHYLEQNDSSNVINKNSRSNGELKQSDKVETLFNEMQPFLMASNLFWAIWAIQSAHTSKIHFGYWEMAKSKWEVYLFCKEQYKNRSRVNLGCDGDILVQSPKM